MLAAILMGAPEGPSPTEPEIQEWVRAAQRGDRSAIESLYAAHIEAVYRAVLGMCGSQADAEDSAQEAFVSALRALGRYRPRPGSRFVAWLLTLALNAARKRARSRQRVEGHADEAHAASLDPLGDAEDARRMRRKLLALLADLPSREREVMCLRYGAELSANEVAGCLGLSASNVRKICERQRRLLLEQLREDVL